MKNFKKSLDLNQLRCYGIVVGMARPVIVIEGIMDFHAHLMKFVLLTSFKWTHIAAALAVDVYIKKTDFNVFVISHTIVTIS